MRNNYKYTRDFNSMFEQRRRDFRILQRVVVGMILAVWIVGVGAAGCVLTHPEAIGGFTGRVVAGYEAAR